MVLLSAKLASRLRAEAEARLTATCTIQVLATAPDGAGGRMPTWVDTYEDVACLVVANTSFREALMAGKVTPAADVAILLPTSATITAVNRIKVGSTVYEVVGAEARTSQYLQRVECKRIG
jgi:head-tail adaptor